MLEIAFLTVLTWLTYLGAINNGFVSDDIEAIQNYDGKFMGWRYGQLTKFIFYRLFQKSHRRNHIFPIIIHNANAILLYLFLAKLMPNQIAIMSATLFAIHPINTQAVAWVSARGYPLGLFWMLLGLNLINSFASLPELFVANPLLFSIVIAGFSLLYFLGTHAQFAIMMTFPILAFTGNYFLAMIGFGIAVVMGLDIVKEVVGIRTKVFKAQNMGANVKLHYRRFIVAVKSLYYYTRLCICPKRMGLYHVYGYHFDEEMLKEDSVFWRGFAILLGMIALAVYGNSIVRFGLLWYISYIFIFLNWITIHQFVSERYCYIANVGMCILLSYAISLLPHSLIIFAAICGLYLMRTWVHLPTYGDEVQFYQSNVWNFPDSEVAFANLGVTYMKRGLIGSALDMWLIALKINSTYDVAHYNISSTLKTKGQLADAAKHLKLAVESPQCHFKELWTAELINLNHEIEYATNTNSLKVKCNELLNDPAKKPQAEQILGRIAELEKFHLKVQERQKADLTLLEQQQKDLEVKLVNIKQAQDNVKKPIDIGELVKARDAQYNEIVTLAKRLTNEDTQGGIRTQ